MNRHTRFAVFTAFFAIVLLGGCGLGLSPAWKDGSRTSVSLRLSTLGIDEAGSPARAIMPGSNYLYIRTIGVSGKTTGALYGPYSVNAGGEFVTSDILPGEYREICVLASSKNLEAGAPDFNFFGGTYSFRGIMSLPDDRFLEFISDAVDKSAFDSWFDGVVCFGETKPITITEGTVNAVSITLTPTGSPAYQIPLSGVSTYRFSSAARSRHFYRLNNIKVKLPVTSGSLVCTLTGVSGTGATLSGIALYSRSGLPVATTRSGADLASGLVWTIEAATINAIAEPTGYVELYQYMDFSGDIDAIYENTTEGGLTVSFDGDPTASFQNHKVLFAIYGAGAATSAAAGIPWENIPALAYAIMPLNAAGDGSLHLPLNLIAGETYYVSAQVDSGDHYASLADLSSVDIATIVPYRGDYVTNGTDGMIAFNGSQTLSLRTSDFTPYTDYVYFVAQDGNVLADGSTIANRTTLTNAITLINALSPSDFAQIYLTGSINGQDAMDITRNVCMSSYNTASCAISSSTLTISAIPYIRISNGGSLTLDNVSIDCSQLTGSPNSLIYLPNNANSSLRLGYGSSLIGGLSYSAPMFGGGVYVGTGCTLQMMGSTIQDCRIIPSTGASGAAVYVAAGGAATLQNATFTGNSAVSPALGIVYVDGIAYAGTVNFVSNTGSDYLTGGGGSWNPLP